MNSVEVVVLKGKRITDFAKARNELLKKARSEWVFFVDTDEVITPELRSEVIQLFSKPPVSINGYYVKRKIYFLGKWVGEDKVLRLGRRDAGLWQRKVHEVWKIKGRVGTLKNYLIHNTYESVGDAVEKINFYSSLHAKENVSEGKGSNLFKIILYPKLKFIQNILMGRGFVFSVLQSFHSFLGWSKQWELQTCLPAGRKIE